MSEFDGGASSAPADSGVAPAAPVDTPTTPPRPVSDAPQSTPEAPKPEPVADKKPVSTREALAKAAEKVGKDEKADKPAPKPIDSEAEKPAEPKPDAQPRGDRGQFASKETKDTPETGRETALSTENPQKGPETAKSGDEEAPARFSATAKAKWAAADPEVRAEVRRMERELTQGYEKHKADADEYGKIRHYDDYAKTRGSDAHRVLDALHRIDQVVTRDPVQGAALFFNEMGLDFGKIAQAYLSRSPEQHQQSGAMAGLQSQLAQVTQQLQQVTQASQSREQGDIQGQIAAFAKDNPRFEELRPEIAKLLNAGISTDLADAYARADRMNPAAQPTPAPQQAPAPVPVAHTDAGTKSISGAPASGSNPAKRAPSPSSRAALERAFSASG